MSNTSKSLIVLSCRKFKKKSDGTLQYMITARDPNNPNNIAKIFQPCFDGENPPQLDQEYPIVYELNNYNDIWQARVQLDPDYVS